MKKDPATMLLFDSRLQRTYMSRPCVKQSQIEMRGTERRSLSLPLYSSPPAHSFPSPPHPD